MSCHLDLMFQRSDDSSSSTHSQNLQIVMKAFARGIEWWEGRSIQSSVQMTQFKTVLCNYPQSRQGNRRMVEIQSS